MLRQDLAPLAPLTTLGLGGPARRLWTVEREAELVDTLRELDGQREPVLVLGGGSNLVIADAGFSGTVVRPLVRGLEVRDDGDGVFLTVAAGEPWDDVVAAAVERGLAGVECMSGIPGLAGATPMQNVGAYGQELSDTCVFVRVFDRQLGEVAVMPARDCGFAYRHSRFRHGARYVVLGVTLRLTRGDAAPVRYAELAAALGAGPDGARPPLAQVRRTVLELRRKKGMVLDPADPESRSVGSFFTNPVLSAAELGALEAKSPAPPPRFAAGTAYKVPAAWLVEQAGFVKGTRRGAVGVSRKHSLALVHYGGGTSAELVALAREIRDGVSSRFGVWLEPEPIFVDLGW